MVEQALEVLDVRKSFGGIPVLDNVSLTVRAGACTLSGSQLICQVDPEQDPCRFKQPDIPR